MDDLATVQMPAPGIGDVRFGRAAVLLQRPAHGVGAVVMGAVGAHDVDMDETCGCVADDAHWSLAHGKLYVAVFVRHGPVEKAPCAVEGLGQYGADLAVKSVHAVPV